MNWLRFVVLGVLITAVSACTNARLGKPVSISRGEPVSFAGGDLEIRSCGFVHEFVDNDSGDDEAIYHLILTVNGQDREIERRISRDVVTVGDAFEITMVDVEPDRDVMCTVLVERVE